MSNPFLKKSLVKVVRPRVKKWKWVRRRTTKRARDEREYNKRVRVWLSLPENQWCLHCLRTAGTHVPATQVHHRNGRRGRLLLYETWWRPVCAAGQVWVHTEIKKARALDLMCEEGKWNSQSAIPYENT